MLRIKELNLTCMINDSERITEKLGHCLIWFIIDLQLPLRQRSDDNVYLIVLSKAKR